MNAMQSVIEIMLAPENIISESEEDYVSLIQEWSYNKTNGIPRYHFDESDYSITWFIPFHGISQDLGVEDELD